ncbi:hypothetical protein CEUSTIGMA_g9732.t1 [Chlamydomonas eustigma]|uniref:CS domain-containing protein n=1 Tax=Chlamydomonas eustigma TaxID=1157962 RepID=A0A250XGX8_9CHLO|nr:hypothetical protein CEUSTIGMA_g9732.t1 [Chlamydomonas eustigma]|eukprot:GAX82303.1 hypothetical protein CEUSTIGMA_g9732.t1 [Chlamydomonas eustigma]
MSDKILLLRLQSLKRHGNELHKQGNFGLACEKYTDALALAQHLLPKEITHAALSHTAQRIRAGGDCKTKDCTLTSTSANNAIYSAAEAQICKEIIPGLFEDRSHALYCAARYSQALHDAHTLLKLKPQVDKPHYHAAQALEGLGRHASAAKEFIQAYWCASTGSKDQRGHYHKRAVEAVYRLSCSDTCEELLQVAVHIVEVVSEDWPKDIKSMFLSICSPPHRSSETRITEPSKMELEQSAARLNSTNSLEVEQLQNAAIIAQDFSSERQLPQVSEEAPLSQSGGNTGTCRKSCNILVENAASQPGVMIMCGIQSLVWEGQRQQGYHNFSWISGSDMRRLLLCWMVQCSPCSPAVAATSSSGACSAPTVSKSALVEVMHSLNETGLPQRHLRSWSPHTIMKIQCEALLFIASSSLRSLKGGGSNHRNTLVVAAVQASYISAKLLIKGSKASTNLNKLNESLDMVAAVVDYREAAEEAGSDSLLHGVHSAPYHGRSDDEEIVDFLSESHFLMGWALLECALELSRHSTKVQQKDMMRQTPEGGVNCNAVKDDCSANVGLLPRGSADAGADSMSHGEDDAVSLKSVDEAEVIQKVLLCSIRSLTRAATLSPGHPEVESLLLRATAASPLVDGRAASNAVREARQLGPLVLDDDIEREDEKVLSWLEQLAVAMVMRQERDDKVKRWGDEAGEKLNLLEGDSQHLSYQLVTQDGRPFEGPQTGLPKHPFGLSRVYYDSKELPCSRRQVWCQISDGSCRWRQSSSEIQLLVLQIPSERKAKHLEVVLGPHRLLVKDKKTSTVYLSGQLYRSVKPEGSSWEMEMSDMQDEEIFDGKKNSCKTLSISLEKTNSELLSRSWRHAEMWWPRLLNGHPDISWDDYEKDYSDLPAEILYEHKASAVRAKENEAKSDLHSESGDNDDYSDTE